MPNGESFEEEKEARKDNKGCLWNLFTFLLLVATAVLVAFFILIYNNPYSFLNPFPPPKMDVVLAANATNTPQVQGTPTQTSTATETEVIFPPTWTPTININQPATATAFTFPPTWTQTVEPSPAASATNTQDSSTVPVIIATNTAAPQGSATATVWLQMPYAILGNPSAVASTFSHPDTDCHKWMGVAGQVLDMQEAPVVGITIELGGTLKGIPVDLLSLTGTALQYGTAGYEFTLGNEPVASSQTLWIQLLDQSGQPISDKVSFDTYSDCAKNLILITFKQVRQ